MTITVLGIGQDNYLDQVSVKRQGAPTELIIFVDSLLYYNRHIPKDEVAQIKYYQALAYLNSMGHEKGLEKLYEISDQLKNNPHLYIESLLQQSNSNVYLKNFTEATSQALEALNLAKEHDFKDMIAASNSALSFLHYSNNDYLNALAYLENSLALQKEENDSIGLSSTYNNIAILYKSMFDFPKALEYNKKSLAISLATNDYIGIGKSHSNIGRIYEALGAHQEALEHYHQAIRNNQAHDILNSIPFRNIAEVYTNMENYPEARKYNLQGLKIEEQLNNQPKMLLIYTALLNIAIKEKDFEKALEYQKKIEEIRQINTAHANNEKVKMLESQYKLYRGQQELQQAQKINTKNKIIFGVVSTLFLMAFLFTYQRYKNRALKIEKEKLFLEQSVLRSQMNPHFIFNALSAIQNSLLDNEPLKSAAYLSRFAKLIRQNFDFINQKTITLQEEIDSLRNYMDTQQLRFNGKFDYEINLKDDIDSTQIEIPPLIIQPFIENAIEHGFKNIQHKGKIVINISRNKHYICYEIRDNGVGYSGVKKDNKLHAIDIFKKRLKLIGNGDEKTFKMESSASATIINFWIKEK